MTQTEIPPEILHLDPDLEPVVVEKHEPEPTCQLGRSHPYDSESHCCGRPAVYLVSLDKPCGHNVEVYLCLGCWKEVEDKPKEKFWTCRRVEDGKHCDTQYLVQPAITRWERIK